jgi:phage replication O-like protein O
VASPQLEDGYTMIANELLEAITRTPLGQHESRVFFAVIRLTYGYRKKEADIPLSLICKTTSLTKQDAYRALNRLTKRNMLTKTNSRHYAVQKDYTIWLQQSPPKRLGVVSRDYAPSTDEKSSLETTPVVSGDYQKSSPETTFRHDINKERKLKENTLRSPADRESYKGFVADLRAHTGRKCALDALRRSRPFKDWLAYLNDSNNKVGVLIEAFKVFHIHAPDQDWENIGGRMGQLFTLANKDAGYLLRIMWETAAADIAGSHLNFIQGRLRKESHGATKGISRQLPSHYETPEEFRARTTGT